MRRYTAPGTYNCTWQVMNIASPDRGLEREGEFRSILLLVYIVGGKVWNMDRDTGMRLRKVSPQCSTVIHARISICECCHAFTLKREARNTASSPAKRKRALESRSLEDTLRRQENNRIRMASMRSSETGHHGQYALCKCIGAPRVCTLVLFIIIIIALQYRDRSEITK